MLVVTEALESVECPPTVPPEDTEIFGTEDSWESRARWDSSDSTSLERDARWIKSVFEGMKEEVFSIGFQV